MKNNILVIGVTIIIIAGVSVLFFNSNLSSSSNSIQQNTSVNQTPTTFESQDSKKTIYSLDEVSRHATEDDCWMAIGKRVFNATSYIAKHPGGRSIVGGCGKDATLLFNERPTENKGPHPDEAQKALEQLYIGDLGEK